MNHGRFYLYCLIFLLAAAAACAPPDAPPTPLPTAVWPLTPPPAPPLARAVATPAIPPSPTAPPRLISAAPGVPPLLVNHARRLADELPGFGWTDDAAAAAATLVVADGQPLARWFYAAVAPFATVEDDVSLAALQAAWQEGDLLVTADAAVALAGHWGQTKATAVSIDEIADRLWDERPSLALVPFHALTPRLKVLALDGQSPLDAALDAAAYLLQATIGLVGEETAVAEFAAAWDGPRTNRDVSKMTRVAMTGVTALTRATAYQMEIQGITAPGTDVAPVLQAADVAHVSHEVPFAADCPYPDPLGGTVFCARDDYLELLTFIGADVVELTGNHVNDWGAEAFARSLALYEAAGMRTFGGGRDLAHAAQPLLLAHNGNPIAFVGCNPVGPAFAWATETRGGSRPCDETFAAQIGALRAEGYLVIATQQYHEFYHYAPTAQQQADFRALAAAGATAVSGSQAHHAQGFDFYEDAFIHYGLGNLFFDQMDQLGTRQSFIDTYVFYDGRLLSVTLWTGLIESWCCPREMTAAERAQALTAVFQASGW